MSQEKIEIDIEDMQLNGGRVFLPERLQDMIRNFLRYYVENCTWGQLDADEKKLFGGDPGAFELIERWARLPSKSLPWPFAPAKYDYAAAGPWPDPKAVELDREEHDRIVEFTKESTEIKKREKAIVKR